MVRSGTVGETAQQGRTPQPAPHTTTHSSATPPPLLCPTNCSSSPTHHHDLLFQGRASHQPRPSSSVLRGSSTSGRRLCSGCRRRLGGRGGGRGGGLSGGRGGRSRRRSGLWLGLSRGLLLRQTTDRQRGMRRLSSCCTPSLRCQPCASSTCAALLPPLRLPFPCRSTARRGAGSAAQQHIAAWHSAHLHHHHHHEACLGHAVVVQGLLILQDLRFAREGRNHELRFRGQKPRKQRRVPLQAGGEHGLPFKQQQLRRSAGVSASRQGVRRRCNSGRLNL